jgi:hypothetical protein
MGSETRSAMLPPLDPPLQQEHLRSEFPDFRAVPICPIDWTDHGLESRKTEPRERARAPRAAQVVPMTGREEYLPRVLPLNRRVQSQRSAKNQRVASALMPLSVSVGATAQACCRHPKTHRMTRRVAILDLLRMLTTSPMPLSILTKARDSQGGKSVTIYGLLPG